MNTTFIILVVTRLPEAISALFQQEPFDLIVLDDSFLIPPFPFSVADNETDLWRFLFRISVIPSVVSSHPPRLISLSCDERDVGYWTSDRIGAYLPAAYLNALQWKDFLLWDYSLIQLSRVMVTLLGRVLILP